MQTRRKVHKIWKRKGDGTLQTRIFSSFYMQICVLRWNNCVHVCKFAFHMQLIGVSEPRPFKKNEKKNKKVFTQEMKTELDTETEM